MKRWLIPTSEKADRQAEKAAEESGEPPSQRPSTSCAGRGGGGGDDNRKAVHKQSDQPSSKCRKYREEYIQYGFTCLIINEAQHPQWQCMGINRHGSWELEAVPLSDGTISRRITDMALDIKCQLIDRVKKGK
ncbi:hypothetical protein NQZ68_001034 [Dissostichus eleginoides]|nr:hypothetical protein NQZ68_001034 [Dissostichus eleginoides]